MNLSFCNSLPELFFENCKQKHDKQHLIYINKETSKQEFYNWQQTKEEVLSLSNILFDQKVQKGDRVMLVSENRPEWLISDISIMTNGAITVPNYTTYSAKDFEYVIQDCKPVGLIVSNENILNKIISAANNLGYAFNFIIHLDKLDKDYSGHNLISYAKDIKLNSKNASFFFNKEILHRKDPACIIYTSGTEGNPKGVILSHGGILSNCDSALDLLKDIKIKNHTFLTWLPLSHSYEHTAQFVQIAIQAKVFYAESLEKLLSNLKTASPTIMTAVPKINTMVGPLMRREKVRKIAVRRLRIDEDNVVETVQKRTREEDDDDIESEVTNVRQKKMKSELNNKLLEEDTSILSFLVDPEDHVQTIENFFDLSFLVKVQTPFKSIIFETRTNGIY